MSATPPRRQAGPPGPHELFRDIRRLAVDGVVNAANGGMLGCFSPCHGCIDNAIHTYAGVQLRAECAEMMDGGEEPPGRARITGAYNLPCSHVIHTVGPIVRGPLTEGDRELLRSCYGSCLDLAHANGLETIAFCCISTGEFGFPQERAAHIAVNTVRDYLATTVHIQTIIFNVFKDEDLSIYRRLLS